jgi:CRP/FNR family cyclic AMP-dependent transcriptional regulator
MQLLSSCYLFKGLSEFRLQRLTTITKETPIQKGQWIMLEGKKAEELFIVKEGTVELMTKVEDDFELPIAMLRNPGECTGTASLVAPHEYSLSARCQEDGTMLVIQQEDLKKLIQEDHKLGCIIMENLAQHMLERLKETRDELKIHFKTLLKSAHH